MYDAQLSQLDRELCAAFHESPSMLSMTYWLGSRNLRKLARDKQASVTRILTQMLNDKKEQLPYLATALKSIPRDKALGVAVLDQTAEGLLLAGRLANKPFKQAVRHLAAELNIPSERVIFGPPKSLAGITRKLADSSAAALGEQKLESKEKKILDIFDLNRATICFEDEAELRAILAALPRHFGEDLVVLKNKFQGQWEKASQPPCVHLNLKLKVVPPGLQALLATADSGWVVELQLTLRDFLEVKKRCHAIYEILRLPSTSALPRACLVCGMLQTFVRPSQLQFGNLSFRGGQKFVQKAKWYGKEVAYSALGTSDEHRATFLREVGMLTRLEHPNIVQILGVVREEDQLGFITEWASKDTLWDLLRLDTGKNTNANNTTNNPNANNTNNNNPDANKRHLRLGATSDVWDVALQLCDALVYVHDQGVVHFDLKSQNVLCVNLGSPQSRSQSQSEPHSKWRVKLCDFGLSRELKSSIPSAKAVGGTLHWQAPETFGLIRSFLPAIDVYSFGGVLINMFGQAKGQDRCWPWMSAKHEIEVRDKVLKGEKPPELDTISQASVRELAKDCFSFEAASRPSMREVRARLVAAQLEWEEQECVDELNTVLGNHIRQLLAILGEGRKSFAEFLPKYRDNTTAETWTQVLNFLDCRSSWSPRFEVVLAMCRHFVPESASCGQEQLSSPSPSLLSVSEKRLQEVVGARYLSGWCLMNGVGGAKTKDESRALLHYSQASLEGYAVAQYELAMCFRHGRGVAQDRKESARLFEQAAEQGHIGAQLCIARCYGVGEGVPAVDLQAAMSWLFRANAGVKRQERHELDSKEASIIVDDAVDSDMSERKKKESQSYLCAAACFEHGKAGVEQDIEEAHRLYKLYIASMSGSQSQLLDAEDQFNLGECYYHGRGVEVDEKEAARLFRIAADRGHAEGQCKLGLCYYYGKGVDKDIAEAIKLCRLSANQKNSKGQSYLGVCYEHGIGVDKDIAEAVRLYRLSAAQGNSEGQSNLGVCLELGQGVEKDITEAVRLYRLSANQGSSYGQSYLGKCYAYGKVVDKDMREAMRLYRLSANQGNSEGQSHLGVCYEHGQGVDKDIDEAVRLYRLSANQGNSQGQSQLGLCYKLGHGVDKDITEAVRLYCLSANQGNSAGLSKLGVCYELGQGVDKDITKAVRLYRLSANKGDSSGQSNLGLCYEYGHEYGKGIDKDMTEAVRLYGLSADQGNSYGQSNLSRTNGLSPPLSS